MNKFDIINLAFESSSEDEEMEMILSQPTPIPKAFMHDSDDDENIISACEAVLNTPEPVKRTKLSEYVEKTVPTYSDSYFLLHFRLQRKTAYDLIERFKDSEAYASLHAPLSAETHILCFLWFAGHASSFRDVAYRFGITLSTMHAVLGRVLDFLLTIRNEVIQWPNEDEKKASADFFLTTQKFPGVIGAIGSVCIQIKQPEKDADSYQISYKSGKKTFGVHCQAVVDCDNKFIDVFAGYPGAVRDATVFKHSDIYLALSDLCSDNYAIVGNNAYPLTEQLLVPYQNNGTLTDKQKHFNSRLSSCRVQVDHTFVQLKQRFRQLYFCQLRSFERIVKLINACCVLHNIADVEDLIRLEAPQVDVKIGASVDSNVGEGQNVAARLNRDSICEHVWRLRD